MEGRCLSGLTRYKYKVFNGKKEDSDPKIRKFLVDEGKEIPIRMFLIDEGIGIPIRKFLIDAGKKVLI